jgi:GntR family transcriptional repressor for pyruvate dehydrogenase complex
VSYARETGSDAVNESLAEVVAERLLESIIDGRLPAKSSLPPEADLAAANSVSRLTVREAIRILRTQNVVQIRRGRGTEVNPPERWNSLEAIVRASASGSTGSTSVSERLLEARRMLEVGAAQLAAARRTDADLEALSEYLDLMKTAADQGNVDRFVDADIRFHACVVDASGNVFVPALFGTFGPLLIETRRQTSSVAEIRRHAIDHHEAILRALRRGNSEEARLAMDAHMEQTSEDLRRLVLGVGAGAATGVGVAVESESATGVSAGSGARE